MVVCPQCKGEKEFRVPSNDPRDVYATDGPVIYETYTCRTCEGAGEISELTLAVYKARGGPPPPPPQRGF